MPTGFVGPNRGTVTARFRQPLAGVHYPGLKREIVAALDRSPAPLSIDGIHAAMVRERWAPPLTVVRAVVLKMHRQGRLRQYPDGRYCVAAQWESTWGG